MWEPSFWDASFWDGDFWLEYVPPLTGRVLRLAPGASYLIGA